jgi:hypothetical protein
MLLAIPEQERRVLHFCVELTPSIMGGDGLGNVRFLVRPPIVGVGTSKPSAVPVVKAPRTPSLRLSLLSLPCRLR